MSRDRDGGRGRKLELSRLVWTHWLALCGRELFQQALCQGVAWAEVQLRWSEWQQHGPGQACSPGLLSHPLEATVVLCCPQFHSAVA